MKCSEFIKLAKKNGWRFLRQAKGSHEIWTDGKKEVSVPNHGAKEMKKGLERSLRKEMGM